LLTASFYSEAFLVEAAIFLTNLLLKVFDEVLDEKDGAVILFGPIEEIIEPHITIKRTLNIELIIFVFYASIHFKLIEFYRK
jgi:hypothetical protein